MDFSLFFYKKSESDPVKQTCYSCDGNGMAHIGNYENGGGYFNITLEANGVCTPLEERGYYQVFCLEYGLELSPCTTAHEVYPYRCIDGVRHECGEVVTQYHYENDDCTFACLIFYGFKFIGLHICVKL